MAGVITQEIAFFHEAFAGADLFWNPFLTSSYEPPERHVNHLVVAMKTIRFISVEQTEGLSNPKEHDWCVLQLISCRWHKAAQANVNTKEGSEKAESRKRQSMRKGKLENG
ncbi:hypothetical protein CIRG_05675 [Coccidioides immitis RMSCC 2394]|uniref:Uncharacterized protein n=1 Tax=Coccidioides immitis RMSCC 2394 TaxID=404692 RepID=A0A0J6YG25_COCIT|nr:hypothetical protein CIRG_05675 [Coccidioides immitis RMSCC 2394]